MLVPYTIDVIGSTPAVLRALLGGLPPDVVDAPAGEGWSPADVVAHLLVSWERGGMSRARAIVERDEPELAAFDEDAVLRESGYRERPLGWLLDELERRRAEDVAWLRALDGRALARRGLHSEAGWLTAEEVLHHMAHHDLNHLRQLTEMLMPALDERRGGMRRY